MIEFKLNNKQICTEKVRTFITFTRACQTKKSKHGNEAIG